ncbi:phage tail domain-containing protein [Clostridium sp.]|uniref:phage tail domain-containing protein n=1 Tax=Clostridium sp. TaxID=1506 RepID=UPI003217DF06
MQVVNFEYNNELLSDYNLIVCNFDGSSGFNTIDIGNKVVINKVKAPKSNKYKSIGYKYEEAFTMDFQVGKIDCDTGNNIISEEEINSIVRWLNRKIYAKLKIIYDDGSYSNIYYNGIFNVELIKLGDDAVGLNLTFESDSPFAYMEEISYTGELSNLKKLTIHDISDETGYIYANTKIECLESGNYFIDNDFDYNRIIINNCSAGEIITLDGENKIISTNLPSHSSLPNDFNYNFLRVVNNYNNVGNIYSSNLKCKITIIYSPIRKVGATL